MKRLSLLLAVLLVAATAQAQEQVIADRFILGSAACAISSGSGTPEGSIVGTVCALRVDTATGNIYLKTSGSSTTGWSLVYRAGGTDVPVADGGTGASSFTSNGVLYGNGTSALLVTAQGPTNSVLTASAGAPSFSATPTVTSFFTTSDAGVGTSTPDTINGISYPNATVLHLVSAANQARLAVTSASGFGANFDLVALGSATDKKHINIASVSDELRFRAFNDAGSVVATPLAIGLGSTGSMMLTPGGDLITDPAGNDILPVTNYDIKIGAPSLQYLSIDVAELHAQTLVAQGVIATIGGFIEVAPTTQLTADLAPAGGTITVKHNEMAAGDRVLMKTAPGGVAQFEVMAILAATGGSAGAYTYTVTRNLDGTGANQWYAGDAVLNTGTTGDGFIDLYSTGGIFGTGTGPTIVGNVRTSSTYNAVSPRWAIGNLDGLYGYSGATYGAAFGDASATNVTIDATNGLRIRSGTTNKLTADTSGNLNLVGDLIMGTSGVFRSGATAFGTTTGYWLDYNAGTPRMRIGNPAGNRLSWDGTDLTLVSATVSMGSTGISIETPSTSAAPSYGYKFSTAMSGTNFAGTYAFENGGATQRDVVVLAQTSSSNGVGSSLVAQNSTTTTAMGVEATGTGRVYTFTTGNFTIDQSELRVKSGGDKWRSDSNGDIRPHTDNTMHVGVPSARFAYMTALAFNFTDASLDNGWSLTEAERIGVKEPGVGLVDERGNLIAFFGRDTFYTKPQASIDDLPYHVTTLAERIAMDREPEKRIKGYTVEGAPIYKTTDDVVPMPDTKKAKSNTQRKPGGM